MGCPSFSGQKPRNCFWLCGLTSCWTGTCWMSWDIWCSSFLMRCSSMGSAESAPVERSCCRDCLSVCSIGCSEATCWRGDLDWVGTGSILGAVGWATPVTYKSNCSCCSFSTMCLRLGCKLQQYTDISNEKQNNTFHHSSYVYIIVNIRAWIHWIYRIFQVFNVWYKSGKGLKSTFFN